MIQKTNMQNYKANMETEITVKKIIKVMVISFIFGFLISLFFKKCTQYDKAEQLIKEATEINP